MVRPFNGLILHAEISMVYPDHWFFNIYSDWKQHDGSNLQEGLLDYED